MEAHRGQGTRDHVVHCIWHKTPGSLVLSPSICLIGGPLTIKAAELRLCGLQSWTDTLVLIPISCVSLGNSLNLSVPVSWGPRQFVRFQLVDRVLITELGTE